MPTDYDALTDRELMDRYLERLMNRTLGRAKRGHLTDAYRTMCLHFGVEESTPRTWRTRGEIPRHVRRQIVAEMQGDLRPELAVESLAYDPAVMTAARDIQAVYDRTGGKGEVWRSLMGAIQMAKTWTRHGRPPSLRHVRPLPRG